MDEINPLADNKALNVFLYVANRLPRPDLHSTFKIMYFAEVKHLSKYGRPIIDDVFHALPYGPVPTKLYDEIQLVKDWVRALFHPQKSDRLKHLFEINGYLILPKEDADLDELSESDKKCIDKSIQENKDLTFDQLTKKSHGPAYLAAKEKRAISFLDIAKEGGANEAMIGYIKELNELSQFRPNAIPR
jgi:hypothetical protein